MWYRESRETVNLGSVANEGRHVRGTSDLAAGAPRDEIELQLAYLEGLSGKVHPSMAVTLAT